MSDSMCLTVPRDSIISPYIFASRCWIYPALTMGRRWRSHLNLPVAEMVAYLTFAFYSSLFLCYVSFRLRMASGSPHPKL
ncbi:uncharacterized protein BO66DRAFT_37957 [Aspergillus aculeatinus CBS 121060]|uniref:Uncharacterized protein n=1 Tax=Aspergillus aculeatinus CBS 121060 TaxID=1448322 RepID=A0ACD1HF45_9EURO|nr:hypothetical protein BO66DRAFT_37957 [Aspergillus aculeatinus CBS 121060]RAH72105.1 hypothetical protein BO66DRAFT_37957 [Aspergillus aculeatinus CBS 121060]